MKLSKKQTIALDLMESEDVSEVLYGGSAGSGKSYLLSYASLKWCYKYPGIRGLLGRKTRSTLYKTTVNSLLEVARLQGLKPDVHFKLNPNTNIFYCNNGSEILLYNLETNPSDPNYDELGSLEITFANIDECPQVEERLFEIIGSRIRYKLLDYCPCGELTAKMKVMGYNEDTGKPNMWFCPKCNKITRGLNLGLGLTANPTKNWVKQVFYDPYVKGELPKHRAFVPALPDDNKDIDPRYLERLKQLNEIDKQRLLYGNWEYADDETQLLTTLQINKFLQGTNPIGGKRYITADIALMGSDMFVITVWEGWHIIEIVIIPKSDGQQVINELMFLSTLHHVEVKNICYDADGVGGFIGGFLKDALPFNNGSSPILTDEDVKKSEELKKMGVSYTKNYPNLKTQCVYEIAEKISKGICTMSPDILDGRYKDRLASELSYWRRDKVSDDTKLYIIKKEVVKKALNTSPDISDSIMMRALFDLLDNESESPYSKLLTKSK